MKKYALFLFVFAFVFGLYNMDVSFVGATVSDCPISHTLRVGSKGSGVACLQASLGISADGKFGPKTKAAVEIWQATKNLVADGIFGPRSRAAWISGDGVPNSKIPMIYSLSPTSGIVDGQVTIYGNNFTSIGNKIKFGDSNSENDPAYNLSSNGASITFTVPSTYYVACFYTIPACKIATRLIQPGAYGVSVINANGASNAIDFIVTSS